MRPRVSKTSAIDLTVYMLRARACCVHQRAPRLLVSDVLRSPPQRERPADVDPPCDF